MNTSIPITNITNTTILPLPSTTAQADTVVSLVTHNHDFCAAVVWLRQGHDSISLAPFNLWDNNTAVLSGSHEMYKSQGERARVHTHLSLIHI